MAVFNTALSPTTNVSIAGATLPAISNTILVSANTEYTIALPLGTLHFQMKTRGAGLLKFAYVSGQSGSNYFSVYPGGMYQETGLDPGAAQINLYVQATVAGETVEIVSWS
jgi:hypothetical protein